MLLKDALKLEKEILPVSGGLHSQRDVILAVLWRGRKAPVVTLVTTGLRSSPSVKRIQIEISLEKPISALCSSQRLSKVAVPSKVLETASSYPTVPSSYPAASLNLFFIFERPEAVRWEEGFGIEPDDVTSSEKMNRELFK